MKKYKVTIPEVHTVILEVPANDEQEAINKASMDVVELGQDISGVYEYTMDQGDWKVEYIGEYSEEEPFNPFEKGPISQAIESILEEESEDEPDEESYEL